MPAVVEAEIGGTARIECNFSIPENASYTYIDWFYVSAGLGEQLWLVGWGGNQPGASCRAAQPSLTPCLAGGPQQQAGEAVPRHGQRHPGG